MIKNNKSSYMVSYILLDLTSYLKKNNYWCPLVRTFQFFLHFVVVMSLLYCSAMVFAVLEDSDVIFRDHTHHPSPHTPHTSNTHTPHTSHTTDAHTHSQRNSSLDTRVQRNDSKESALPIGHLEEPIAAFIKNMDVKYKLTSHVGHEFQKDLQEFLATNGYTRHEKAHRDAETSSQDTHYIFMKWFHFVTIATTTIGYGHVYPKTDNGKLFYIFFSIIGITLMMTLLKSCGTILSCINKTLYSKIKCHLMKDQKLVSDELMAVVSITFMFLIFMLFVVWHDTHIEEAKGWKLIDTLYFWMVTFTTVGFGDVCFSLEVEINHVYEMLFYRVFGLAFLAGILDSIHVYLKVRQKAIARRGTDRLTQIRRRLIVKRNPHY